MELIQTENQPTALGPYVRRLAENGDLSDLLARVRATGRRPEPSPNGPRAHVFELDDLASNCRWCPLPEDAACHQVGFDATAPVLRIVTSGDEP